MSAPTTACNPDASGVTTEPRFHVQIAADRKILDFSPGLSRPVGFLTGMRRYFGKFRPCRGPPGRQTQNLPINQQQTSPGGLETQ